MVQRIFLIVALLVINGCVAHKLVSTPIRVVGAVTSVVPVVGGAVDKAADKTADAVDEIPI